MPERDSIYKINDWTDVKLREEQILETTEESLPSRTISQTNTSFAQLNVRELPVSCSTNGEDKLPKSYDSEKLPEPVLKPAYSLLNLKTCYIPKRYVFLVLGFLGGFFSFAMRVNLSVAIVAMVNQTASSEEVSSSNQSSIECPFPITDSSSANDTKSTGDRYNWNPETQGAILGSYYYGYVIMNLPGGILAEKFGAKWVFGGGMLLTTIFCLLTPTAASSVPAFIAVRVLQGLSDGVTLPAITKALSIWAPESERSVFSSVVFMGVALGSVFAMILSGYLCSTDFMGGWPSAFYVIGIASTIWFLLWCYFVFETPRIHPSISREELNLYAENSEKKSNEETAFPWRNVLTSAPAWAVLSAHIGNNFGFLILLSEVPTYLNTVLHFDLASNGLLSALPFICQAVCLFFASFVADGLRQSNKLTTTSVRKLFNTIGSVGAAVCLFAITLSGCQTELIIALLCLGLGINGCVYSGFNCTHIDMYPEKSATLYAITNTISNLSGIIGPMVVSAFVSDGATVANWSKVFYTTMAVYIITAGIFHIFGSAELQAWSSQKCDSDVEECKEEKPSEEDIKTHL